MKLSGVLKGASSTLQESICILQPQFNSTSTFTPYTQTNLSIKSPTWVSGVSYRSCLNQMQGTNVCRLDKKEENYDQVYNNDNFEENKSSLGHEVIAGGAAFAGFKAFEDHQRKEGKPVSHAFAKELLAGFAGAEVCLHGTFTISCMELTHFRSTSLLRPRARTGSTVRRPSTRQRSKQSRCTTTTTSTTTVPTSTTPTSTAVPSSLTTVDGKRDMYGTSRVVIGVLL